MDKQDGIFVDHADHTRRYVGTIYVVSTGTTADSAAERFIWNYYNRVDRFLSAVLPSGTWTYNSATIRAINSNTTDGQGRVSMVLGAAEDAVAARNYNVSTSVTSRALWCGIGVDSTTVNSAQATSSDVTGAASTYKLGMAEYQGLLAVGYHNIQSLEATYDSTAATGYGGNSNAPGATAPCGGNSGLLVRGRF